MYVHHVVAELAYGETSSRTKYIRHLDDNKLNNYPSNVVPGTPSDNREDSRRNGTMIVGSQSHHAKISEEDVRDIRRKIAAGIRNREIVKEYGLTSSTITNIRKRKIWKHVV